MPAFTLAQLIEKVRRLGNYENVARITDTFITECINMALSALYDAVSESYAGHYDTFASLTTTAGDATINLPADFYELRAIDRDLGSNEFLPLRRINLIQSYRYSGSGAPQAYMLHGGTAPGTLRVWPVPDQAYALRITYEPLFTALALSGDSFDFRNGWERFVIYDALVQIDIRELQPIGEHKAIADEMLTKIRASAQRRDSAEPEYLAPRGIFASEFD